MELKRIADSRTPDAEKLIALHRETFPEYERFCDTPLMANMIDHERSMYFNAVYEKGELAGLFVYWDLGDSYYIHFIGLPRKAQPQDRPAYPGLGWGAPAPARISGSRNPV